MRGAAIIVAVVTLIALGCDQNREGTPCDTRVDCGSGYLCRFLPDVTCTQRGRCTHDLGTCRLGIDCSGEQEAYGVGCYSATTGLSTFTACGCDGSDHEIDWVCPQLPISFNRSSCADACRILTFVPQPLYARPRARTEFCAATRTDLFDTGIDSGRAPARCCDCSLAGAQADVCANATNGDPLPAGCCNCFTDAAPDPTGRCTPPGGHIPAGATRWCCPITEDVASGVSAADGGR